MRPFHVHPAAAGVLCLALLLLAPLASCQDEEECQPYQWDSDNLRVAGAADPFPTQGIIYDVQPGEINCRFWNRTPAQVNYYTCTIIARNYQISNEKLFFLNPGLKHDCSNIQPNTDYCVTGFVEPVRAYDGLCGPPNNNATCLGTGKQCCNSETWTCGDSEYTDTDTPGTCYEGDCDGDVINSTDGTCGIDHGLRFCAGKWGNCCSLGGRCGTGNDFCGLFNCQSGDCDMWGLQNPPLSDMPPTQDGWCGGESGLRCSYNWGPCCNANNVCGDKPADCYVERGCQTAFGLCAYSTVSSTSTSTAPGTATSRPPASSETDAASSAEQSTTQPASAVTPSASVTSSVTSAEPATTASSSGGPTFVPAVGAYSLLGCYREQDGSRALPDLVADDAMTIELCVAAAAAAGRTFAGVAYGRECWFGSSLRSPLTKVADTDCMFLCPGDRLQYCGSGNHMVLYSTGADPLMPSHPASVGDFTFVAGDMTLDKCADFCSPTWSYFGVEYGQECYCGNSFSEGSVAAPAADCSMSCPGNGAQFCGAGNRLSVYERR